LFLKRTDLALETRELYRGSRGGEPEGVQARQYTLRDVEITDIRIVNETGAAALGKPQGRYITAALAENWLHDTDQTAAAAGVLADLLRPLLPQQGTLLAVGLGNRRMTPDRLGPDAVEHIIVTRHLTQQMPQLFSGMRPVCTLTPGVLGLTGIETAEIVRGVVQRTAPAAVIAIDALCARSAGRLCRTFQLSDTGISPGSGAGNRRCALDRQTLGVPVISVGVPTVIDAATLLADALETAGCSAPSSAAEPQQLLVAPKDIDALSAKSAKIIGYAVNLAAQGDMTTAEMESFLE